MFRRTKNYFNRRFNRFYRRSRLYMIIDIVLIVVVIVLAAFLFRLYSYQPEIALTPWSKPVPKQEIDLNNPPLDLTVSMDKTSIYWQDGADIIIRLKNNGKYDIKNGKLLLVNQSIGFNLSRLEFSTLQKTSLSGMEIKGFTLYVDEIPAGTDREVSLKIFFQKQAGSSRTISTRLDSEYSVLDQVIKESLALEEIKVASELSTTAAAYYHSPQGDQLGAGMFPPATMLPTNFWVFLKTESSADFRNLVVSAKLVDNVEFTGNISLLTGNINYNSDTRQVIWQAERINGDESDSQAGFEIELTPNETQVGSYAKLLTNIRYQAVDNFTGLSISGSLPDIDTSLKNDAINRDDGIVVSIDSL